MKINMEVLSLERLEKLSTKRLKALYKAVRNKTRYGLGDYSNANEIIGYKNAIKEILDTREHIEE